MRQKKRAIIFIAGNLLACTMYAQGAGVNSPYSRYGFGKLDDQALGFNKGMAGLAYGIRDGAIINQQNPASYSQVDSVTFLFDTGISLHSANFNANGVKQNIKNATFDYVTLSFRLRRGLGFSMGFMPYSTIGYELNKSDVITNEGDKYASSTYTNHFSGEGGLHKVYAGIGWRPFKNFSIGMNASYIYGGLRHRAANIFASSNSYSTWRIYNTNLKTYMLELGAQYTLPLSKQDALTIGAVYTPGHSIKSTANVYDLIGNITQYYTSSTTYVTGADDIADASTPSFSVKDAYDLPTSFGIGFAMKHKNSITYGIDYTLTKWGDAKFPVITTENGVTSYKALKGILSDRHKITAGFEVQPNMYSRNYLKRIKYKAGAYYATPYTKVKGQDGATEYGVSAGLGLPIQNQYNNRSFLNVSAQWVRIDPKTSGFLKENYFRISIGLTFNESWFRKWKVE